MTLGQRIQEMRKQRGMSQESLGDALGVSRQAVSKWEGDNGIPELDTLIAISRLFGVTVGQLLGVEEPAAQQDTATSEVDEDKVEAILRRYAEQTAAKKEGGSWLSRWGWIVSEAIVLTTVFVVLVAQVSSLRSTVKLLQSDLSALQVDVSNHQNDLSWQIRNTIYEVLAEEAELLSTFQWKVVDYDQEGQTATLRLEATMKEYSAGSRLQFSAQWRKVDDSEGRTAGDWVEGPDFRSEITVPLNYHTEIGIRVEDTEGNIQEQTVEELYGLHPDNFHLQAFNLTTPFAVTVKGFGTSTTTVKREGEASIDIVSNHPDFFWPEEAVLTARVNGAEVLRESMSIRASGTEGGGFCASIQDQYCDLTLKEGDTLEIALAVTDNLGRTEQFLECTGVENGRWERQGGVAPAISVDD